MKMPQRLGSRPNACVRYVERNFAFSMYAIWTRRANDDIRERRLRTYHNCIRIEMLRRALVPPEKKKRSKIFVVVEKRVILVQTMINPRVQSERINEKFDSSLELDKNKTIGISFFFFTE